MKKVLVIICFVLIGMSAQAQKKNAKVSVTIDGVCMMCKKRIEKAALNTKGVKFASWDVKTHKLSLILDERKTNLKKVQKNIADVGHNSKGFTAKDHVYNALPPCCKYKDPEVVKNHPKMKK